MHTLSESELCDAVRNRAVQRLTIRQTETGKFQIVVALTWKEGEINLVTARKNIREWASLDRLARHITDNYGTLPHISLSLHQGLALK